MYRRKKKRQQQVLEEKKGEENKEGWKKGYTIVDGNVQTDRQTDRRGLRHLSDSGGRRGAGISGKDWITSDTRLRSVVERPPKIAL